MSQAEIDQIIAVGLENAGDIPNRGIFYSWGSDAQLLQALNGRAETITHKHYNPPMGGGANGGPGLYISTSIADGAASCPTDGQAVLLQVEMPPNQTMPYIRTTHIGTMTALRRGTPRITTPMLFRHGAETPPILLQHARSWHCLKTSRGVTLKPFDGRGHSARELAQAVHTLQAANRAHAAATFLSQLLPEIRTATEAAL